ncbi:cyclin-dependent kinase 20 isoform X2 [Leptinotarsa decemlineata]|uniref:cyclin-dependent kinase 20 isoform X2 n=1 Tax=Leptinotarsa decemlineata TaxID=7539 RepID=UPI003D308134
MNNYKLLGRAGEGAHGFVFKGKDLRNESIVALKKITVNPNLGIPKSVMREICALRVLKYKNDLKPANLLISRKGILKIADFGLARIYDIDKSRLYSHQVATRWYRAPELLYGSRSYTLSVDIWSVGCIIAEMISRQPLFPGETDIEQLAIVLSTLGTPNERVWPGLTQLPDYNKIAFSPSVPKSWSIILPMADDATLQLISKMLIYDGNKRLSSKEALQQNFFREKPFPCKLSEMPRVEEAKIEDSSWDFREFEEFFGRINC